MQPPNEQSQGSGQFPSNPNMYYGTPQGPGQFPPHPPYYVSPMPPPPPQKKGMPKWIIGLLIGGFVLVFALCGVCSLAMKGSNTATVTTNTSSPSTSNTKVSSGQQQNDSSSASTNGNTVARPGQTITVDDVSCTALSAQILPDDGMVTPKQGNHFVVVHVKIINNSTDEKSYNEFDFHAKSSTGNITTPEFMTPSTYTANNELNSGNLSPGGSVEGDIIFQVPIGDANAEMTWKPSFFNSDSQYAWVLGVK